jgi:hypothetical protein
MIDKNKFVQGAFPIAALTGLLVFACPASSRAQSASKPGQQSLGDVFHEAESKYMFGFVDGADIGNEGEKAIEFETTAEFKRRGGKYSAVEQEIEFEHVVTQNFAYEMSAHFTNHQISGVEGLDDINQTAFSGASTKLRYLILGRGPGSPIGLTISAEPEWSRIDGTDGTQTQDYSTDFRIVADTKSTLPGFQLQLCAGDCQGCCGPELAK